MKKFRPIVSRILSQRYWLRFSELRTGVVLPPHLERLVHCDHSERVFLGNSVRFLRGAVVLADPEGSIQIDDAAIICRFSVIQSLGGTIRIGKRTCVGDFSNLFGFKGGLDIGDDVLIASGCHINPSNHSFNDPDRPIAMQPSTSKGINIGNGVWIGAKVVILDGITIGPGAIVGAGSIVTRDVPANAIAAGVPCQVIRSRPGTSIARI